MTQIDPRWIQEPNAKYRNSRDPELRIWHLIDYEATWRTAKCGRQIFRSWTKTRVKDPTSLKNTDHIAERICTECKEAETTNTQEIT